jgi:hypothetical protein
MRRLLLVLVASLTAMVAQSSASEHFTLRQLMQMKYDHQTRAVIDDFIRKYRSYTGEEFHLDNVSTFKKLQVAALHAFADTQLMLEHNVKATTYKPRNCQNYGAIGIVCLEKWIYENIPPQSDDEDVIRPQTTRWKTITSDVNGLQEGTTSCMFMGDGVSACMIYFGSNDFVFQVTINDQNQGIVADILLPDITGTSIFNKSR